LHGQYGYHQLKISRLSLWISAAGNLHWVKLSLCPVNRCQSESHMV
jgi:hypothetical protein